jgi:two-component system, sensor histidine kinase
MVYKQKILLVDDTQAPLVTLHKALKGVGAEIITVSNGSEAIVEASKNQFDLVLIDMDVFGMESFEVIKFIRKEEKNRFIPVLVQMSLFADKVIKGIQGIQAGAVDYITKPVSEEMLISKVKLLLAMQENKNELKLTKHKLNEKINELDLINKKLVQSNEKLEKANQTIKKKAQDVEAAAKIKSSFLATMSHEIRTPLNAIMGSARLLKESVSSEEKKQYTDIIETSGDLLLGIINNVLDYSRIEAHKLEILKNQFSLDSVVGGLRELLRKMAENNKLQFDVQADFDLSQNLIGDDIRLQQVILNLCNNAIKYTVKGEVVLKVEVLNETDTKVAYKFSIIDTGIGISEEDIKYLFKPFSQFAGETNKDIEGTGLGLSIVKGTVELMGGKVGVESKIGFGSTFWFELEFEKENIVKKERRKFGAQRKKYTLTKNKLKILVADDYKFSRIILEKILNKSDITSIDFAQNGWEAVALTKKNEYDIVFMDCLMPILNGFKATSEIRKLKNNSKYIYIIALSADVMSENKNACMNAGMDYFMVKPFSPKIINNTIREIILKKINL